jgi:hypothetical protein
MNSILAVKNISLGIETDFGTPVSPSAYGEITDYNIKFDKDMTIVEDTAGTRKGSRKIVEGAQKVGGNLKGFLYPSFFGFLAKGALGSVSSALNAGETVVYKHTVSQATSLPSYTLQIDRGNTEVVKITSAKIKSLKLSSSDKLIEMDVAFDCQDETTGSAFTASQVTENPMVFHNAKVGFGADIAAARTAVGASDTPVLSWDFEYDNDPEVSHASGSKKPYRIDPKVAKTKFDFSAFFDNATARDAYRNVTKQAAVIRIIGAAIGNASYYQIDLELPNIYYTSQEVEYKAGELLKEKCELKGLYDDSATHAVQMLIYNLKANYNS